MSHIICLILAYLVAAAVTPQVSLSFDATEWTSFLTYLWIALAWLGITAVVHLLIVVVALLFVARRGADR